MWQNIHTNPFLILLKSSMAFSYSVAASLPNSVISSSSQTRAQRSLGVKCQLDEEPNISKTKFAIGSPVVFIEAPKAIKTATSMPCLRINSGLVKPGDVGRIVSRKPKDVWAVRLNIGTYLIDGKYFKALQLEE